MDPLFANGGMLVLDLGASEQFRKVMVQQTDQFVVATGYTMPPGTGGHLIVVRTMPDGTLDPGFDGDGILEIDAFNGTIGLDLFQQDDQKIVVAGVREDANSAYAMLIVRLLPDGSLDPSFGVGGMSELAIGTGSSYAYAAAPLPGHRILLAGAAEFGSSDDVPVVVRVEADGTLDPTFGNAGVAALAVTEDDSRFWDIGLQSDGSIVACGQYDQGTGAGGFLDFDVLVARFTTNGTLDTDFGNGGILLKPISVEMSESAAAMAIDPNDNILLCGHFALADQTFDAFVMRLDPMGQDDAGFGNAGLVIFMNAPMDQFMDVGALADGRVLACGTSGGLLADPRHQVLVRYLPNGAPDPAFGANGQVLTTVMGGSDVANAFALTAAGRILVAGQAQMTAGRDATLFRHLNEVGSAVGEQGGFPLMSVTPNPVTAGGPMRIVCQGALPGDLAAELVGPLGGSVPMPVRRQDGADHLGLIVPATVAPGVHILRLVAADGAVVGRARLVVER
ncbi:MAG: hypothetical protein IT228_10030 [Flavobacteriales bacterium]|nr:hypothetical protein [Flavobacteriales bacterium]